MSTDPFDRFTLWFTEAQSIGLKEPTHVVLATVRDGQPSQRVVLLKDHSPAGLVFYTNYESRKARELEDNPCASLLFYWGALGRQVRIEGRTEKVSAEVSDAYFASRSRASQLGAWASDQSRPLADRAELIARLDEVSARFDGRDVERPPHWGGFCLVPTRFEFWSMGEARLHTREVFERDGERWRFRLLNP